MRKSQSADFVGLLSQNQLTLWFQLANAQAQ
jgi:hypothetical protein